MSLGNAYLQDILFSFRKEKELAEKAFRQVESDEVLTTDGEKTWRIREDLHEPIALLYTTLTHSVGGCAIELKSHLAKGIAHVRQLGCGGTPLLDRPHAFQAVPRFHGKQLKARSLSPPADGAVSRTVDLHKECLSPSDFKGYNRRSRDETWQK